MNPVNHNSSLNVLLCLDLCLIPGILRARPQPLTPGRSPTPSNTFSSLVDPLTMILDTRLYTIILGGSFLPSDPPSTTGVSTPDYTMGEKFSGPPKLSSLRYNKIPTSFFRIVGFRWRLPDIISDIINSNRGVNSRPKGAEIYR